MKSSGVCILSCKFHGTDMWVALSLFTGSFLFQKREIKFLGISVRLVSTGLFQTFSVSSLGQHFKMDISAFDTESGAEASLSQMWEGIYQALPEGVRVPVCFHRHCMTPRRLTHHLTAPIWRSDWKTTWRRRALHLCSRRLCNRLYAHAGVDRSLLASNPALPQDSRAASHRIRRSRYCG